MENIFGDANISTLVSVLFTVLSVVAGGLWLSARGKFKQIVTLFMTLSDAIEDNAVSPEEVKAIKDAFNKVLGRV